MFMIAQSSSSDNSVLSERRKRGLKKKLDKALSALRHDRANHQLHIEIGDLYAQLDQADQADHYYSSAIELLQQGTTDEKIRKQVIMLYGKILSLVPGKESAYLSLAQEYDAAGQKEKAVRFLLSSGKRAFDQANYTLALTCYNQVIVMGRGNPYLMERCTEIYLKLGNKDRAMTSYIEIGDLYAREEKYIDALDYYKKAHAVGADSPELLLKIARMYYAMEWKENAAAELVKLAEYYERKQNIEDAVKYYQHSSNLDPDNQKAREGKFRLMYQHTELPQAAAAAATQLNADVLGELDQLEHHLTVLDGENDEAMDELSELIDLTFHEDMPRNSAVSQAPVVRNDHEIDASALMSTDEFPAFQLNDGGEALAVDDDKDELAFTEEHSATSTATFWDDRLWDLEVTDTSSVVEPYSEEQTQEQEFLYEEHDRSVESARFALPAVKEWEPEQPDDAANVTAFGSARFALPLPAELETTPVADDAVETPEHASLPLETPSTTAPETPRDNIEDAAEALVRQVMEMDIDIEPETLSQQQEHAAAVPPQENALLFDADTSELQQKLHTLEKHLQNTEEEKYFLQEQFAAQIGDLKTRETLVQRQYETAQKERKALQDRLDQMMATYEASRKNADQFDDARYETMIRKIQDKKDALQQHLNKLLQEREQNGHVLQEELQQLGVAKERLQHNVESIQQAKARVEYRINTELRQAQEQIRTLSATSLHLQKQLHAKQDVERELYESQEKLRSEKEALQDQFTDTIAALTSENESLERQVQELSTTKSQAERALKKKLHTIYHAHQRLKGRFQHILTAKEQELSRTAQQLSEFADEYVKLEGGLNAIRTERDQLDMMLVKETATRESLQEKLFGIERHIDSLEAQGSGLLDQLEEELNRQLTMKQSSADQFQDSLEELEQLLTRQEEEIHALELL